MDNRRRQILIGTTILLSGCATRALFENRSYDEDVSSILISQDKRQLVFMGRDYHYVFEAPHILIETLDSDFHAYVRGGFYGFAVERNGSISGTLELTVGNKAPESARAAAEALGYVPGQGAAEAFRYAKAELAGTRYKASDVNGAREQKLNRTYNVKVSENYTSNLPGKLLLSPITVAVDGVLLIGGLPLMAPWFLLYAGCGESGNCR